MNSTTFPKPNTGRGRVATQPLRLFALSLYVSIFLVETIHWLFEWCGSGYQISSLFTILAILGLFVVLEWGEQRYFTERPAIAIAIAVLLARMVLTEAAGRYSCSGFHTFFAFLPPLLAYLYIGQRAALITAGLTVFWYLNWILDGLFNIGALDLDLLEQENVVIEIFIFLVGTILVLVVGRVLVLEERNRQRAEALVLELEQSQRQVAELAAVDERNRIARDIHDSVGHHLTAVNILIEKAQAFRAINPEEADQALRDAKRSANLALTDVRESVSALRAPDGNYELGSALQQLVDGFGRIPTTLIFTGDETPFSKSTLLALYRVAQEGLTNIEKHAGASSAELTVSLQPDHGTLVLKDNGQGVDVAALEAKSARGDAHFGLTGLRERLELLGGTLTITSEKNNGMALHVRVPAKGLA